MGPAMPPEKSMMRMPEKAVMGVDYTELGDGGATGPGVEFVAAQHRKKPSCTHRAVGLWGVPPLLVAVRAVKLKLLIELCRRHTKGLLECASPFDTRASEFAVPNVCSDATFGYQQIYSQSGQ